MVARAKGGRKTPERVIELIRDEVAKTSQAATARAIGLTLRGVQNYLKGIGDPTTATLEKLADYFHVSMPWLRGDTDLDFKEWEEVTRSAAAPVVILDKVITAVMDAYTRRGWPIPQHGEEQREKYLGTLRENVLRESEHYKLSRIKWELLSVPELDKIINKLNSLKIEKTKKSDQPPEKKAV